MSRTKDKNFARRLRAAQNRRLPDRQKAVEDGCLDDWNSARRKVHRENVAKAKRAKCDDS